MSAPARPAPSPANATAASPGGAPAGGPGPDRRGRLRRWLADLLMGARLTVIGGRESWFRTGLTAVGVGLGVAVLLLAASIPHALAEQDRREQARGTSVAVQLRPKPSDRTALFLNTDTFFREEKVLGRVLWPEGDRPPVPPGLSRLPREGEMVVSPALRDLLASPEGKLLRERLPYRVGGTVAEEGLTSPHELLYYAVDRDLTHVADAQRIDRFDGSPAEQELDPALLLLVVIACVVLLLPVGVFVAAAVRFGGERRDRRLAALRLLGTDSRMTQRIAAGEALVGAVLGLAVGSALFLAGRQYADSLGDFSTYPTMVRPATPLAVLLVVGVPAAAVLVTLLTMRRVTVEPLGVVRGSRPRRRRLWWRLVSPALGLLLLLPLVGDVTEEDGELATYLGGLGAVLVLVGVTALLPWLVEAAVRRMRGSAVPLHLALRRLQLDSTPATRAVSGITLAVAGAVALKMLFGSVAEDYRFDSDRAPDRYQLTVGARGGYDRVGPLLRSLERTEGVRALQGFSEVYGEPESAPKDAPFLRIVVADCPTLRMLAKLPDCGAGDAFLVPGQAGAGPRVPVRAGMTVRLNVDEEAGGRKGEPVSWTVPRDARTVTGKKDWSDVPTEGAVLVTPQVRGLEVAQDARGVIAVGVDPDRPDAEDLVRNAAARHGVDVTVHRIAAEDVDETFAAIQRGLFAGAVVLLLLIGASMLVSTVEQLRERKRLLAVLAAFGTPRTTLAWSVVWQTAVPVVLGLALAVAGGTGLGVVLQRMVGAPVSFDWAGTAALAAAGGALILAVTACSLPALWRMMRPEGLRSE